MRWSTQTPIIAVIEHRSIMLLKYFQQTRRAHIAMSTRAHRLKVAINVIEPQLSLDMWGRIDKSETITDHRGQTNINEAMFTPTVYYVGRRSFIVGFHLSCHRTVPGPQDQDDHI